MTTLEKLAREAWLKWGSGYAAWRICTRCGEWRYCRSKNPSGPHLCLECFDQR